MTKKVLVTEKLAQAGLDRLAEKGLQVDVKLKMSTDELIEAIPDYDALVVRSATHVTREVIAAASKLRIIGRAGVGVDNVDVEAATEAGIIVCNAPTSNIVSAAEQTMCLMLACARNTAQANASMHAGEWSRGKFCGSDLYEKTLAIFGMGRSSEDGEGGGSNPLMAIVLAILAPIAASLIQFAISRSREYLADASGAR